MAKCPRCNEEMSLLSKICSFCGHVVETEDNISAEQFADHLEKRLYDIKQIPEPSFGKSLGLMTVFIYPIITVTMVIIAILSESGLFWILAGVFLILSIIAMIRKSKGTLGNAPFDRQFKTVKNEYEYADRIARRNFGQNYEVRSVMDEIALEIEKIEAKRKKADSRNFLICVAIVVLLGLVGYMSVHSVDKTLNEPAAESNSSVMDENQWKKAVADYEASDKSALDADDRRLEVIETILAAGQPQEAERFFLVQCMGQMRDYDCAAKIVHYYVESGDTEAAEGFVAKCTSMRYGSDKNKLNNLINK